jgi:hypothetical protein
LSPSVVAPNTSQVPCPGLFDQSFCRWHGSCCSPAHTTRKFCPTARPQSTCNPTASSGRMVSTQALSRFQAFRQAHLVHLFLGMVKIPTRTRPSLPHLASASVVICLAMADTSLPMASTRATRSGAAAISKPRVHTPVTNHSDGRYLAKRHRSLPAHAAHGTLQVRTPMQRSTLCAS